MIWEKDKLQIKTSISLEIFGKMTNKSNRLLWNSSKADKSQVSTMAKHKTLFLVKSNLETEFLSSMKFDEYERSCDFIPPLGLSHHLLLEPKSNFVTLKKNEAL